MSKNKKDHRSYRYRIPYDPKRPTKWPSPEDFRKPRARRVASDIDGLNRFEKKSGILTTTGLLGLGEDAEGYYEWYYPGNCTCNYQWTDADGNTYGKRSHPSPDEKTGEIWVNCRTCGKDRFAVWKHSVPNHTPWAGHVANHYTWWLLHETPEDHMACALIRGIAGGPKP